MSMSMLGTTVDAVKALRTLGAEELANELIGAVADELIDEYGLEQSLRVLHGVLHAMSDIEDYDEFINAVRQYRAPIQGDDEPADWEWVFYALLWLTEPEPKKEAYDEATA
jgi:hypothetical protein